MLLLPLITFVFSTGSDKGDEPVEPSESKQTFTPGCFHEYVIAAELGVTF